MVVTHENGFYYGPTLPDTPRTHGVKVEITTDNFFTLEKKFFCDRPSEKVVTLKVIKIAHNMK